jgi:oxygen-independent coproporphyrinogen-3 oxidase
VPDVGVYLHVPFCERVCPYCDFAVVAARSLAPESEDRYVDALLSELEQRSASFAGRSLASLYLGGGTPSLLRPVSVERLVRAVREAFPPAGPVEITLELNPSTVERERLPAFAEAGVSRVSVGVQSFDDTVLRRLGRAHRADEARLTLAACRSAGFAAVSLDLIFCAPGQSRAALGRDLDEAIAFGPEHLSAYELTVEAGTPFALAAARGQLDLPDEAGGVAHFEDVARRLAAAGYRRYELSNYARPGCEAVHNSRYWQRLPVLGLGAGAFSSDPARPETPFGVRRSNLRSEAGYVAALAAGASPAAGPGECLDAATARGEAVFLALRTARGLAADAFAGEFGAAPRAFFADEIDALVAAGLLGESAAGDLCLSERGRLLSDSVFGHFVAASD